MGGVTRTFVDDISVELGPKGELQEGSWRIIREDEGFAREVVGRDDGANHNPRLPRFPVSPAAHSKYLMENPGNMAVNVVFHDWGYLSNNHLFPTSQYYIL